MGRRFATLIGFLVLAPGTALAVPFGGGLTPELSAKLVTGFGTYYRLTFANPHPQFERVSLLAQRDGRLCQFAAASKPYPHDRWGADVRVAFDAMRRQLSALYGPSDLIDSLRAGAYHGDADEWVEAIYHGERVYKVEWSALPNQALREDIAAVTLTVRAVNRDDAYLTFQYRFTNFAACDGGKSDALR